MISTSPILACAPTAIAWRPPASRGGRDGVRSYLGWYLSQKLYSFCDIMKAEKCAHPADATIIRAVRATKGAKAFSARDFAHVGSPAAIRKALERLTKRGDLRRVRRGFYDRPGRTRFSGRPPPTRWSWCGASCGTARQSGRCPAPMPPTCFTFPIRCPPKS
jgi:hypothetical protein